MGPIPCSRLLQTFSQYIHLKKKVDTPLTLQIRQFRPYSICSETNPSQPKTNKYLESLEVYTDQTWGTIIYAPSPEYATTTAYLENMQPLQTHHGQFTESVAGQVYVLHGQKRAGESALPQQVELPVGWAGRLRSCRAGDVSI